MRSQGWKHSVSKPLSTIQSSPVITWSRQQRSDLPYQHLVLYTCTLRQDTTQHKIIHFPWSPHSGEPASCREVWGGLRSSTWKDRNPSSPHLMVCGGGGSGSAKPVDPLAPSHRWWGPVCHRQAGRQAGKQTGAGSWWQGAGPAAPFESQRGRQGFRELSQGAWPRLRAWGPVQPSESSYSAHQQIQQSKWTLKTQMDVVT